MQAPGPGAAGPDLPRVPEVSGWQVSRASRCAINGRSVSRFSAEIPIA